MHNVRVTFHFRSIWKLSQVFLVEVPNFWEESSWSIVFLRIMWKCYFFSFIISEGIEYFLNSFYLIKTYSFTLEVNCKGFAISSSYTYFFLSISWQTLIFSHIFCPSNLISWIFDMIGVHSSLILSLLLLLLLSN